MSLTEDEKARAREHMGYVGVSGAASFSLGLPVPAGIQTQFLIEPAMNRLLPSAEARFRLVLKRLDEVEQQIADDTENLAVDEIGEIKINKREFQQLVERYRYWQGKLANMLAVPPNPYDQRPYLGDGYGGGGGGLNVPVLGG